LTTKHLVEHVRLRRQARAGPSTVNNDLIWLQAGVQLGHIRIDIETCETCERCAGPVKIIACIEEPAVIERILAHLNGKAPSVGTGMLFIAGGLVDVGCGNNVLNGSYTRPPEVWPPEDQPPF
jgi:hypothetical protein